MKKEFIFNSSSERHSDLKTKLQKEFIFHYIKEGAFTLLCKEKEQISFFQAKIYFFSIKEEGLSHVRFTDGLFLSTTHHHLIKALNDALRKEKLFLFCEGKVEKSIFEKIKDFFKK